jgi:hypothetical protein
MRPVFLAIQALIGLLVALFVAIQNFPTRLASMNVSALSTVALNSVALFTISLATYFAFRDGLVTIRTCSQTFLTLALGTALGAIALVVANLVFQPDLNATSSQGFVLLGPVLGLSIGLNMIFFGLFRQVEEKKSGLMTSSFDLTVHRNFVRVLGLLNAYVSPPVVLLSLASQFVLAGSLALLQITVSALALGLYHFTVHGTLPH